MTEGPVPCEKGKEMFHKAWAASPKEYALLYAIYLEHVSSCDLCIKRLRLTAFQVQEAKDTAKAYRGGVAHTLKFKKILKNTLKRDNEVLKTLFEGDEDAR